MDSLNPNRATFRCGDRHFIQRKQEWIEVEAEKMSDARPIRVRFDSREYFELIIKYPKVVPLVTRTRNLQIALGNHVYQIHE